MKTSFGTLLLIVVLTCSKTLQAQEAYLGDIKMTAISFDQRNWMPCDGRLLPISQYSALFSLLGTIYGGDGRTTFALPDLRGRVPMGHGNGPGLTPKTQGSKGGTETNTLSVAQLPSHTHNLNASSENGNEPVPTGNIFGASENLDKEYYNGSPNTSMSPVTIAYTGSGQPVNNMQPYSVVRYVICVNGIYPSRN